MKDIQNDAAHDEDICLHNPLQMSYFNIALRHKSSPCSEVVSDSISEIYLCTMISTFIAIGFQTLICASSSLTPVDESRVERMNQHDRFVKKISPAPSTIHEVIIAVRQKNSVRILILVLIRGSMRLI